MLKSEKWRNVWLREAGTLTAQADVLGTAEIVVARRCAPDRSGVLRACLAGSAQGRATAQMARDVEALLASAQAAVSAAAAGLPSAADLRVLRRVVDIHIGGRRPGAGDIV